MVSYKYIAPGSSLYPCPLFSPPHRPLARIIMCDEPAFHSAHFSQGVRDTQITGASHRYRIVSGSSGEGGGWGGYPINGDRRCYSWNQRSVPAMGFAWSSAELNHPPCVTLVLGLFRTWKYRAGLGSGTVRVYYSVGSVVWMGLWCGLEGAVQWGGCGMCSLFDRHSWVKGGGMLGRGYLHGRGGMVLEISWLAVLGGRMIIIWDVLP